MTRVLSVSDDAKTVKGEKYGVLTGILYLSPADMSGYEVCPKRTPGCTAGCLFTAGYGMYTNVQNSRINRTKWFFEDRETFMEVLVRDIEYLEKKAKRENMEPAVRLNGTSDIAWEKIKVIRNGKSYRNMMKAFPNISFYDYTKILGRKTAMKLPNYHLTFSMSENNEKEVYKALEQGYNVSIVFNISKRDPKPDTWNGYPVVDGDKSDIRFNDPQGGHIIALSAKGKAKHDTTGFVQNLIAVG